MATSGNTRPVLAKRGLGLIIVPAVMFIPFLRFVTVCPPQYGEFIGVIGLGAFLISEVLGLRYVFRCFTGTFDIVAVVCILAAVVGIIVVIGSAGTLLLTFRN